ncbi:MAG: hypothetical protein AAGL90_17355 [Pseudomonadota bacterium]
MSCNRPILAILSVRLMAHEGSRVTDQQLETGTGMKALISSIATLAVAATAAAQLPDREDELLTSISETDLRYIAITEGHEIVEPLNNGVGFTARDQSDLPYILQGAACVDSAKCVGLEVLVVFRDIQDLGIANSINQRYSAIKATIAEDSLLLSRYVILDRGQTMTNLKFNLRNALQIARQIQSEMMVANSDAPEPEFTIVPAGSIAFGDDSGEYAKDGSCDDARFMPDGDDWTYMRHHVLRDATDCRERYESGEIAMFLSFGDNTSQYANNDRCDDRRFVGEGRSPVITDLPVEHDAADCIAAYRQGTINRTRG